MSARPRRRLAVVCVALGLAAAGCGGDDEDKRVDDRGVQTADTPERTETAYVDPPAEPRRPGTGRAPPFPEDQPGGAGDEEPAVSPAELSGRGGRIRPRVVRVPAFIAIRVRLTALDGGAYGLSFAGNTLRVGGDISSASTTLDGLRPGRSIVGRPRGGGSSVRIEASAEPGP